GPGTAGTDIGAGACDSVGRRVAGPATGTAGRCASKADGARGGDVSALVVAGVFTPGGGSATGDLRCVSVSGHEVNTTSASAAATLVMAMIAAELLPVSGGTGWSRGLPSGGGSPSPLPAPCGVGHSAIARRRSKD